MEEMKSIKEVCKKYDCMVDFIYSSVQEADPSVKISAEEDTYEGDIRVLNCKSSKTFKKVIKLNELYWAFLFGSVTIESDGNKVTAYLSSKTARAWSWTKNRIWLNFGIGQGINGFRNVFVDTELDMEKVLMETTTQFIKVDVLPTSTLPYNNQMDTIILNRNDISMVEPLCLDEWLELYEKKKDIEKNNR